MRMHPCPHQARLAKKRGESWETVVAGFEVSPVGLSSARAGNSPLEKESKINQSSAPRARDILRNSKP